MQNHINWERPQRQPIAGIFIVFIKTLSEVVKRIWPFILLFIFREKPEESSVDKYEVLAIIVALLTFLGGIMQFIYFRFQIIDNDLIIKKGWLKKQTIIVPIQNIQTVQSDASFLHRAFGVVKLSIDTAGSGKTEVKIDALHQSMADALRERLQKSQTDTASETEQLPGTSILTLQDKDLLKLSLSANHIETFFLLLSFSYGIYDNLITINKKLESSADSFIPRGSLFMTFLIAMVLMITITISTAKIFFRFYGFSVNRIPAGFQIKSGLFNKREYIVPFGKVQAVTWKANWIRRKIGLWFLEYRIAGADEVKFSTRVQVPVTNTAYLPGLIDTYHPIPDTSSATPVYMHASFILFRLIVTGIILTPVTIFIAWFWWGSNALLLLLLPLITGYISFLYQKRFRLWAMEDVILLNRGSLGIEQVLFKWHKIQALTLKQSAFQRKRDLATVVIHTASDNYTIRFIPLQAAQQIINYGLYKTEYSDQPWMHA